MGRVMSSGDSRRQKMVADHLARRDIRDPRVLAAFGAVPRELFVPRELHAASYNDAPLPIGAGQTISQPYVVAITAQALELRGHERVLEIGTGSGYAAAILGMLSHEVHTIERIEDLATRARATLAALGIDYVHVHHADGTLGWRVNAPYEAIVVSAAAPAPPPSLLAQLAVGGRLVIPTGPADCQRLMRITRRTQIDYSEEDLGDVRFVPLLGEQGWPVPSAH